MFNLVLIPHNPVPVPLTTTYNSKNWPPFLSLPSQLHPVPRGLTTLTNQIIAIRKINVVIILCSVKLAVLCPAHKKYLKERQTHTVLDRHNVPAAGSNFHFFIPLCLFLPSWVSPAISHHPSPRPLLGGGAGGMNFSVLFLFSFFHPSHRQIIPKCIDIRWLIQSPCAGSLRHWTSRATPRRSPRHRWPIWFSRSEHLPRPSIRIMEYHVVFQSPLSFVPECFQPLFCGVHEVKAICESIGV